jgi:hypothetical protein
MATDSPPPPRMVAQDEIFGNQVASDLTLLPGRLSPEQQDQIAEAYGNWLAASVFKDKVAFLDVTFAPIAATETVTTETYSLILAPNEQTWLTYQELLAGFISDGLSIAADSAFHKGLRVNGKDQFLLWTAAERDTTECEHQFEIVGRIQSNPDDFPFHCEIIPTYDSTQEVARSTAGDIPLEVRWNKFVALLQADSHMLRSHSTGEGDDDLGVIAAAPLGVRHPNRPEHFIWIADVFFGLNRRSTKATALSFLRFLALQLLRNNTAIRSAQLTETAFTNAISHEIKRVTDMMGNFWAPPARLLFDVSIADASRVMPDPATSIGRIEINEQYAFLRDNMRVVPFGALLKAARRTIDLWAFSGNTDNLPQRPSLDGGTGPPGPTNWAELTRFAWHASLDQVIMFLMNTEGASSAQKVCDRHRDITEALEAYRLQSPHLRIDGAVKATEQSWDYESSAVVPQLLAMSRVLMAWFANCIEHGSLLHPIEVLLARSTVDPLRLRLRIENIPRGLHEGRKLPDRKANIRLPGPAKTNTRDAVSLALIDLKGALREITENATATIAVIDFDFDWKATSTQ